MKYKELIRSRLNFSQKIDMFTSSYELRATEKYESVIATKFINRMKINKMNYLLLNSLEYVKYHRVIEIYNTEILSEKTINDVTRIILLFTPHILKSSDQDTKLKNDLNLFNHKNLEFEENTDNTLLQSVKDFFVHYDKLNSEKQFLFHRLEMIKYLEYFLIEYTKHEINKIKKEESQDMFVLHYFRPFMRPEEYYHKEE